MKSRTVLVTGGNRGIGLAVVKAMAANSQDRILLGTRNQLEESIAKDLPKNVSPVTLDLSTLESTKETLTSLLREDSEIDVLINNAAVLTQGDILSSKMEDIAQSFQVNTLAPILLMKEILPGMIKRSYGRIVNVSSGWGSFEEGLEGPFAYAISKSGLNAASLAADKTIRGDVKINTVCPGWVRTRMGGTMATKSPEEGADTIVWLANLESDGPSGGFFRDRKLIDW